MTNKELLLRNKLLNNKIIEENSDWTENDEYYGKSKDCYFINNLQDNINTIDGIKNIIFDFYEILKKRYHNNFYIKYTSSEDKVTVNLSGQPIFEETPLNLVIKYSMEFVPYTCQLSCNFIIPEYSEFSDEKKLVKNFKEKTSIDLFDKTKPFIQTNDNTEEIKEIIESIPLQNYLKRKNNLNQEYHTSFSANSIGNDKSVFKTSDWSDELYEEYSIYCPNCGKSNYPLNRKCVDCDTTLVSYIIDYGNEFNSFEDLLTEENIELIDNTEIPLKFYDYLVDSIVKKASNANITKDMNVFDKILYVSRYYVNIKPNEDIKSFGMYDFNTVLINTKYSRSLQSATLIKYLSVDIYIEILEGLFMYIFDVKSNNYVKSFIDFSRYANQMQNFIQKYFPARVEANFIPKEYHNYEDLEQLYFSGIFDEKALRNGLLIGNTYAQEIINILEQILDKDIKNELSLQFEMDNEDTTEAIRQFYFKETLSREDMLTAIKASIMETIKLLKNDENAYQNLLKMKENFDAIDKIN